jgi:hypothetical protein
MQSLTLITSGQILLEPLDSTITFKYLEELSFGMAARENSFNPEDSTFPMLYTMRVHTFGRTPNTLEQLIHKVALTASQNLSLR